MKSNRFAKFALALAVVAGSGLALAEEKGEAKHPEMASCPMDPQAVKAMEKMKALTGTWTTEATKDMPAMTTTFRPTSAGTAIIETMCPGTEREMVNVFTADGTSILMTHFCGMGNQPRMKLASGDDKPMKFEFVDGGNMKSRDDWHMDSVAITVEGDKLTEDWTQYADGKVQGHSVFVFHRASSSKQ